MWRDENCYGKDGTTKIRKCKEELCESVNVRVEDALYERIRSYAAQHQMSMTEVVLLGLNMILSDPE